jgi:peroxiredoxin
VDTPSEHPREQTAPAVGAMAPDFALPDESGKRRTLSEELRAGKPIVLVFMRGEW